MVAWILRALQPRSEPALELHRRAESSVGVMYHFSGLNTGSNSGEERMNNKKEVDSRAFKEPINQWLNCYININKKIITLSKKLNNRLAMSSFQD